MSMSRTFLTSPATDARSYSRSVVVETEEARTIYLCGVVNHDEDRNLVTSSFEDAARACLDRLKQTIEESGGTLHDLTTITVYILDARRGDDFVKIRGEYFGHTEMPASALITVRGLAHRDMMIEIQGIAVVTK